MFINANHISRTNQANFKEAKIAKQSEPLDKVSIGNSGNDETADLQKQIQDLKQKMVKTRKTSSLLKTLGGIGLGVAACMCICSNPIGLAIAIPGVIALKSGLEMKHQAISNSIS